MKKTRLNSPTRRQLLGIGLASAAAALIAAVAPSAGGRTGEPAPDTVVVYLSPTCSCCSRWVQHLRDAGLRVEVRNENMSELKARLGIPPDLASCHTATVGGYVIEGHVPAADIRRLLAERPRARGLAAPGMPLGSPGMEQVGRVNPYEVLLFDGAAKPTVYALHGSVASVP